MADSPGFAINVKFKVKRERREEFLSVMKRNMKRTMDEEPNAMQFVLGQDVDNPEQFYLHEEYKTREDHVDPHSRTEYYDECMKFFATDPFTEPHQADEFVLLHDAPTKKIIRSGSDSIFCANAEMCVKPEARQEFLEILQNIKRCSDQDDEPLCLQYSYGESIHSPNTFYLHEQFTGANGGLEGFDIHMASPHLQAYKEFVATKNPYTQPPVVANYRLLKGD